MADTLILGIGNSLLSDEGVGVHAINRLQNRTIRRPGVRLLDGGTLSFTLLPELDGVANLIVVDAAELHAVPGTVRCFVNDEMDRMIATTKRSVHEVGLLDLLAIARLSDNLPPNRALVAVQPASTGWGESLSEPVEQAMPEVLRRIDDQVGQWSGRTATAP
jgi:hydrogenase maturation protease